MKLAMIRVDSALKSAGLKGRMLLQVHDELVLECPQIELQETTRITRKMMENAYNLVIPLKTEARYGKNWGTLSIIDD
jgi:DNA polymerase-1